MAVKIDPVDATLGAIVTSVDLAELDDESWHRIEQAFHDHALLIFPAQHVTSETQRSFALRFGPLETGLMQDRPTLPISNRSTSGGVRSLDDPVMHVLRGNEGWHTDSSYMPVSAKASMLSARVVPSQGGETEWADMRAAFDELEPELRDRVRTLAAYHSLRWSQSRAGFPDHGGYGMDVDDAPLRPLVKTHPVTGREALFIGRHAHDIPGLEADASAQLLAELLERACRPPRVYRHRWQAGDLCVWDNRCLLHRAHPYDYGEERVLMHTRIAGDPVSEAALAVR